MLSSSMTPTLADGSLTNPETSFWAKMQVSRIKVLQNKLEWYHESEAEV